MAWPAIVLVALALVAPVVGAQAEPSPSPAPWRDEARRIEFTSDADGFRFTSVRAGAPDADVLGATFRLREASFEWSFTANRSGTPLVSRLDVRALLEVRDRDGDGRFGPGDEVVQRVEPSRAANASLEVLPQTLGGRIVRADYPFPRQADPLLPGQPVLAGRLRLTFHVLDGPGLVSSKMVAPTFTPMDVSVEGFPRNQSGTLLVFEARLRSTESAGADETSWRARRDLGDHVASWSDRYVLNGSARAAEVFLLSSPGDAGLGPGAASTSLFSTYGMGTVEHSYSLGTEPFAMVVGADVVNDLAAALGDARVYGMAAFLTAGLVGASAWSRLRRKA